jgi:hypothetical protein
MSFPFLATKDQFFIFQVPKRVFLSIYKKRSMQLYEIICRKVEDHFYAMADIPADGPRFLEIYSILCDVMLILLEAG